MVSTCHWGNLLVWEEGHIQLEVTRKDGSACHDGQINHITAIEGVMNRNAYRGHLIHIFFIYLVHLI